MILERLQGKNLLIFNIQLSLSWMAFGILCWNGVIYYKNYVAKESGSEMYMWTSIFFHPVESSGLNYVVVCALLGVCALFVYIVKKRMSQFLQQELESVHPLLLVASASLSMAILLHAFWRLSSMIAIIESAFLCSLPFIIIAGLAIGRYFTKDTAPPKKHMLFFLSFALFVLVCAEPLKFMIGPVRLMNDYPDIFGETKIKGEHISNKLFLMNFHHQDACAVKFFFETNERLKTNRPYVPVDNHIHIDLHDFLMKHIDINLDPIQQKYVSYLNQTDTIRGSLRRSIFTDETEASPELESCIRHIRNVDIEALKQFYAANLLEYNHQNMGRGQINHLGHILNPLNEYELGKPLDNIYMQYGLGNTFLMKWAMDLFGGISIQSYYKTYVYYIIYSLTFLLMLVYLFKDGTYVLGAYSIIPVCFFLQGYIALALGPGLIPSIHLLDSSVIICLIAFFRRNNRTYLAIAITLVLVSMLINRQFGAALMAALLASLGVYVFENKAGKARYLWLTVLACITVLDFTVSHVLTPANPQQVFPYFWAGLFSWQADPRVTIFAIIYLVVSYSYLIFLKEQRFYLKYVYIFVFMYAHILLLYFFWSGLLNHLPPVIPFCWFQVFIMLYIAEKELLRDRPVCKALHISVITLTILSLLCVLPAGALFYKEKRSFLDNFKNHRTYAWQVDRAKVITTVNPKIMENAILIVQRYSNKESPGIYILSKYDGLLPFLAHRYSAMPFFELTSFLFSQKEHEAVLNSIKEHKPRYLFVDTDLRDYRSDPWVNIYTASFFSLERASRMGRYELLYRIFLQVKNDYMKIDQTELISVYERKS